MYSTLQDLIEEGGVMVYLDDVMIFSETFEEHLDLLKKVFLRLRKECLKLKPKKMQLWLLKGSIPRPYR